ncbi:MAG: His-Xaa-Ser system radical SAM maturase HxsB [Bacteroidales bacterium]|nr:His-Xaa-Ser system radical SAM maturase HxsB [Bacteroidales bacterium]MBQ9639892.1 His-Xaa-Ser system radical SAM maturase HxsB [Bacteroidales bacterium]
MRNYYLLPFDFTRVAHHEVLVNEYGDMLVLPQGSVERIVDHRLEYDDVYKDLVANFFISESRVPANLGIYASRLREKKRFLDDFTALHIFVVTLQCNQNCIYCQASSRSEQSAQCTMTFDTMEHAVRLMFRSPAPVLTMEFQGGEPSLHPALIRFGIETAERINETERRELRFVLCTNCVHLTDEMLDICRQHRVMISTSLDGPAFLHNANRGKVDSYERVVAGIERARRVLGADMVAALQTTSVQALDYPAAIVDEYVRLGFRSLFLRALNPYGLASNGQDWAHYTERFIEFYKAAFEHILYLNRQGTPFVEEFAAIVLRKMLTPFSTGFVDLQSPAGIVTSVLVYNYDGYVYASDESRMLAEVGDFTFRLGSVHDRYEDIVYSPKVQHLAQLWANEALAGCSDCALRNFCGADPVRNYSTQRDPYGHRPSSLLCRKNKAIIEYLISLLVERREEVLPIFKRWLQ